MRPFFFKLNHFLLKRPYLQQVSLFFLASLAAPVLAFPITWLLERTGANEKLSNSIDTQSPAFIVKACVLIPILETLIFQWLVFLLFKLWPAYKRNYIIYILISSLLFGLSHTYDVVYIINTFFIGITFAYMFYFYKGNTTKAFWSIALVHAMHNALVALITL